jgi:phospholipid/cholesterol/gamma-HCH transport system substrate-binding protein
MTPSRSAEIKVGLFVAICLVTIAGLILKFGNIRPRNADTYTITVTFANAGGLVHDTTVMYAGIPVGRVTEIRLDPDKPGQVNVRLAINKWVTIREDAKFLITQTSLLGDRLIEVTPRGNEARPLEDGDTIAGAKSADFNELVGVVKEVLLNAGSAIERIERAVARIDETILSQESLAHVTNTLANVDAATSNTVALTSHLSEITVGSRDKIRAALDDLAAASAGFKETSTQASSLLKRGDQMVAHADEILTANQDDIRRAAKNLADSTERLHTILARLESGEGTAGRLLADDELYRELKEITQLIQRYGLFYNTWFGRKVPADRGATSSPTGTSNTVQFGQDRTGQ